MMPKRGNRLFAPTRSSAGADTMLIFALGSVETIARVRPGDHAAVGAPFPFEVDMAKTLLFDPETGKRI